MEVVYSFWDGSGHRKAIELKKGCTIGKFLEYAKLQLSPDFPEIRGIGSDSLMYVKEDLIIPPVRAPRTPFSELRVVMYYCFDGYYHLNRLTD
jgi:hypothetical protein